MASALEHRTVATNGIHLHTVEAGPAGGPLIILLHGFPEFWFAWRRQLEPLAAAGFRVLAPDQRGYGLSDKPRGIAAYNLDRLVADVVGLIDEAGRDKACIVGHDWGGVVAWWLGITRPERVERLAVLNIPHPVVMRRAIAKDRQQRRRSSYMFLFQLPWLPEWMLRRHGWARAVGALTGTSRSGTFSAAELEQYRAAWSQPGAATGMLNWYRAMLRARPRTPKSVRVAVPTLLIWGKGDSFLGSGLAQASIDLCDDGRLVFLEDASHWVQHEEPDQVTTLLANFFGAEQPGAREP